MYRLTAARTGAGLSKQARMPDRWITPPNKWQVSALRKQSRARRLLRGARNVPCLCCHIISQPLQCLFQLLNSLQSAALWVELELCTVHSIIYSHVAALPSKITQLHGGTNAWTHGQTTFRTNRQYNLLVCFRTQKYINQMGFQTYIWYNRQKCIIEYVIGIGKGLEIYESCTTISI